MTGGTGPFTYLWNTGAITEDLTNVVKGIYTVIVTDAQGCIFSATDTVNEPAAALNGTTSVGKVLCFGGATGSVDLSVSGGTAPYAFLWNNGATTEDLSNVTAGKYSVTISDANGCNTVISDSVAQPLTTLTASITKQSNVSCFGLADGTVTIAGNGGTTPYEYSINGGTFQVSGTFIGLLPTSYIITVRDTNLCSASVSVNITEPEILSIAYTKQDASCPGETDGSITLTITGGTKPYRAIWSDGVLTQNRSDIADGKHSVVVVDTNGCASSLDIVVGFTGSANCLEIPGVITPNNDGFNDKWVIKNIDMFPDAEVFIFSRWGKLVYKTKNISANPWDGTYEGKLLPTDSYHYVLHLNNGSEPRSGVISIIR
jgi:gliding motility-associated-like protein